MNLPDLLYSLTVGGLAIKLGPGDTIDIVGPIKSLTDEQRQGVNEHRGNLRKLLERQAECFADSEETSERESIVFSDTKEGRKEAIRAGDQFIAMAAHDHHTWIWNKIGAIDEICELKAFAERFENDLENFEVFRPIAKNIRILISSRRRLLNRRVRERKSGDWQK